MAEYRCSVKVVSRSDRKGGRSGVAAAAYRGALKLKDEKYECTHDYRRRTPGVMYAAMQVRDSAPAWGKNPERFFNAIEAREDKQKRSNDAQLARDFELNLPVELELDQHVKLLDGWVRAELVDKEGMGCFAAIHYPKDGKNPHAHVLASMRKFDGQGFDDKKNRNWNSKAQLRDWLASWSDYCNKALEEAGEEARVDHRSYKDRGVDKIPGIHQGKDATAMQRKGLRTRRGDRQMVVSSLNASRKVIALSREDSGGDTESARNRERERQEAEAADREQRQRSAEKTREDNADKEQLRRIWQGQLQREAEEYAHEHTASLRERSERLPFTMRETQRRKARGKGR